MGTELVKEVVYEVSKARFKDLNDKGLIGGVRRGVRGDVRGGKRIILRGGLRGVVRGDLRRDLRGCIRVGVEEV